MSTDLTSHSQPMSAPSLLFRAPSTAASTSNFTPPPESFLHGTWNVTHSTLPMWRKNRNVRITYSPIPTSSSGTKGQIDDLVEYQPSDSDKQKSVHGVDTPDPNVPAAYDWRGKGWLKIASSHWEVLGYGDEEGGWVVTWFEKTLFTPAGVDVYAKKNGGLSADFLEKLKAAMHGVGHDGLAEQTGKLFEIKHDW